MTRGCTDKYNEGNGSALLLCCPRLHYNRRRYCCCIWSAWPSQSHSHDTNQRRRSVVVDYGIDGIHLPSVGRPISLAFRREPFPPSGHETSTELPLEAAEGDDLTPSPFQSTTSPGRGGNRVRWGCCTSVFTSPYSTRSSALTGRTPKRPSALEVPHLLYFHLPILPRVPRCKAGSQTPPDPR